MARSKESWLREGAGDLEEADVEDVPVKGESVRVRGLPAAYSNDAMTEAREIRIVGREQVANVNTGKLEILQFIHGVIDPVFTKEEAEQIARHFGPAFRKVIDKIDELSALDKDAIVEAEARFPVVGADEGRPALGDGDGPAGSGSDVHPRVGAGAAQDREGADHG